MPPKGVLKRPAAAKLRPPEPEPEEEVEDEEDDAEGEEAPSPPQPKEKETAAAVAMRVMSLSPAAKGAPAPAAPAAERTASAQKAPWPASPVKQKPASPVKPAGPKRLRVHYEAAGTASAASSLAAGLVRLWREGKLCDATVLVAGGRVPVHRVVLAAHSDGLGSKLGEALELDLTGVSREAADHALAFIYGEVKEEAFAPSSAKVTEEVLGIASDLGLASLAELCASRLATDTDVTNIVARVRLCEQRGLPRLRAALVGALVEDGAALHTVARDVATISHPALMQELLAAIASQARDAEREEVERPLKQARSS